MILSIHRKGKNGKATEVTADFRVSRNIVSVYEIPESLPVNPCWYPFPRIYFRTPDLLNNNSLELCPHFAKLDRMPFAADKII